MNNITKIVFASIIATLHSGCFIPKGLLYTKMREPLNHSAERQGCPKASKVCYVNLTQLKEPVTGLGMSVMWSNRIITDAAEKAGMSEIYYCDLETLSIFLNTYKRERIYFYGN